MSEFPAGTAGIAVAAREAAPLLRVTEQTLKRWRSQGVGPVYCRITGGRVRYRIADLDAWLQDHSVRPGASPPQQD